MRDYEKIVYLNDYKNKKIAERIRKDPDSYEYCIIPNYEDQLIFTRAECIQIGDCYANLIKNGDHYVLVSVLFHEEDWNVPAIVDWVKYFGITVHPPTTSVIEITQAEDIYEAVKFRGHAVIMYARGTKTISLDPNELEEITERYQRFERINNTAWAEPVELDETYPYPDPDDMLDRVYPYPPEDDDLDVE